MRRCSREFPPLRASWSRRGEQKRVVMSGRNPYRVLLGALNVVTGQVVRLVRERCRTADTEAFVEKLGQRAARGAQAAHLG